ncbi:MAG: hypothetical protein RBS45_12660, partial [Anaerolineales bacterium]|nr:hypothetical protein [Anaerolineales bacterium]
ASLPSSASALEIAQTARQTFCHLASTHSTMGKLTTLNCGATTDPLPSFFFQFILKAHVIQNTRSA